MTERNTTRAAAAALTLAAAFALTACQGEPDPEPSTAPAPIEEAPVPEETAEPEPEAPDGIDGEWCPTPESAETACVRVELPTATYDDGTTAELFVGGEQADGVIDYGMDGAPFGTYYPSGIAIEIPDYYPGADLPDEERVWNSQTGTLMTRR